MRGRLLNGAHLEKANFHALFRGLPCRFDAGQAAADHIHEFFIHASDYIARPIRSAFRINVRNMENN
jgi:hypothetical protein